MDREALVLRNRRMTEAFHATPLKHQVRRTLLRLAARAPIPSARKRATERILLIRPDHLGDVLLTTPAIRALREAWPQAEIHALVGPWSADVMARYPDVDVVLTLSFPGFSRAPKENWHSPYQLALRSAGHLRRIGYSSAVILRPDHWWGAMVAQWAGIPERIGYDMPNVRPFLTKAVEHQPIHAVEQNLRLVEGWTGAIEAKQAVYTFPMDARDTAYIDGYLQEWEITPTQTVICIHPGTGTWVKHWEPKRWAEVADTLAEQLDSPVVLTGGGHELALVKQIAGQMRQPACIAAGDTRVGQLAALYRRARVVLGPDSGPLHLAAAIGAPTVALFGPADPAEFAPWGRHDRHIVLTSSIGCRPCRVLEWGGDAPENHPCLRDISVGAALDAARRAAASGRRNRSE